MSRTHRVSRVVALTLAASVSLASVSSAQTPTDAPRPLRSSDIYRVRDIGGGRISPDGAWIAYTVTTTDSSRDKRDSDVWMVSWDGTRTLRMTSSPEPESNPRFSPDNRYLSFVSGRILAAHVPPGADNPNELPDRLVELPGPGKA